MDEETRAQILHPVYRQAQQEKAGLGLSFVASTVAQANGHIEVASTAGKGTTYRVLLPLASHRPKRQVGRVFLLSLAETMSDVIAALAARGIDAVQLPDIAAVLPQIYHADSVELVLADATLPGSGVGVLRLRTAFPAMKVLWLGRPGVDADIEARNDPYCEQADAAAVIEKIEELIGDRE